MSTDRYSELAAWTRMARDARGPLAWQHMDDILALKKERDDLLAVATEMRELADNWPGIAYTAELQARVDALLSRCNGGAS